MATASAPRVNGVGPGHIDKGAGSHEIEELQGLWKAIHAISREDGFGKFTKLVERVRSQEANLKDRAGKVDELQKQLAASEASHDASNKDLLDMFEERYQLWRDKNEALRSQREVLSAASTEKDKRIVTLQENEKTTNKQVSDFEKTCNAMTMTIKKKENEAIKLEAQLKTAENTISDLKNRLKEMSDKTATANAALRDEKEAKKKLDLEIADWKREIKEYRQFTVQMKELNVGAISSQIEALWESVVTLVLDMVGCDLPNHVLETDWTQLNRNRVFENQIPLPRSNTNVAKEMRVAVVLGALASLVIRFLFQPTYVLDERSGLRRLLRYQATIDPLKEKYTRGILLSMKHNNQEDIDQEKIDIIIDDLKEVVRVDVLFATTNDLDHFEEDLEELLLAFQNLWKIIQHGRQKLEPSFDEHPTTTKFPWLRVGLPVAADAQNRTSDAQDDTIIVPQIVQMRTTGDPEPITHGWVLQQDQIYAADEEIRRMSRGARTVPLTEETTVRPRTRTRRAMSISGNASPDLKRGGPFLNSGSAA